MQYTQQELLNILGCSRSTLITYLKRIEFKNIKQIRKNIKVYYENVTEDNIDRLKELLNRKKGYYYV